MASSTTCSSVFCHGGGPGFDPNAIVTLADHNIDRTHSSIAPVTSTVFLNGQTSLSIPPGLSVTIRSNISDPGYSGRVAGAQYRVRNNTTVVIDWTAMNAIDGTFDAVGGALEPITAALDTTGMALDMYTVDVRGMDIGKQWSPIQTAALTIAAPTGFVNGTVKSRTGAVIPGATVKTNTTVSVTSDSSGFYSMSLMNGTYALTAIKNPEYYDNTTIPAVTATANTTVIVDIIMDEKPKGNITGSVTNSV